MTWNILFGGEDRFEAVLALIARERPDVLVLQECLRWEEGDRLARVAEALEVSHTMLGIARPRGSGRRFHVALASRFPILQATTHADPEQVGHAIIEVDIDAPGGALKLLGTHFDAKGEDERVRDMTTLLRATAGHERLLVAGDLNALSRLDPYPENLDDLLLEAGTTKYGHPARFDTMEMVDATDLVDLLYHRGTPSDWITAVRHRGGVHIDYRTDYLLASPDVAERMTSTRVVEMGEESDHSPVIATFRRGD